jgi:hypothetical protein
MAERTKYFAMKLASDYHLHEDGVVFDETSGTLLRGSKHQTALDVTRIIKEGEKWLVLQTVQLMEGQPPRPPIAITEYK